MNPSMSSPQLKRRAHHPDEPAMVPSPGDSAPSSVSPADPSAPADGADSNKRFQVPRACQRCRRLRRGCSEYRPCKRCIDAGMRDHCMPNSATHQALPSALRVDIGGGTGGSGSGSGTVHKRLSELIPARVIDYCVGRFFERLHPTIPILTAGYVSRVRTAATDAETGTESLAVLVAMCSQVLLQAEEPEELLDQGVIAEKNEAFGRQLLDAAMLAYQSLPRRTPLTIEHCLLSFFLYAGEAALFHHAQAFRMLRDATALLVLYQPREADELAQLVHSRLFWVLVISERSHAIRYRRPTTLQLTADTPGINTDDPSLSGFWSLAALFRAFDTSFIALLNQEILAMAPSPEGLSYVEAAVNSALKPGLDLRDTQKANLRVTQLWLRVILWQLRLRLGYLAEESYQLSLTYRYPIEVAKDVMLSTRDLPIDSFKVHGVGLTEKLFDIASALIDVLARIPLTSSSPRGLAVGSLPEDDLLYLRQLITRLPGGTTIYNDLLEKHIQQAVPNLAVPRRLEMPQILSLDT